MNKNLIFLIALTASLPLLAQDFGQRVKESYLSTDKNFDIDCYYSKNKTFKIITPVSETKKSADELSREFKIENENQTVSMFFVLKKNSEYQIRYQQNYLVSGKLSKREFNPGPVQNTAFDQSFETSKVMCAVNFATALPYELENGNYHFNVHPHTIYDWQAKLKTPVEKYLNNPDFKSLIFLETGNGRGNLVDVGRFFNGSVLPLPESQLKTDLVNVPVTTPLIVSPSGNNRFKMKADKEVTITFTGGNHNYCIWNSTRQVLIALMSSKSEAKVNFVYDMKAIVAQQRGMEGLSINFGKQDVNKSNLLFDLLARESIQSGYHFSYLIFFRNLFAQEYSGMYRSFTVNYSAPGYHESFTMNGEGTKDIEANFSYLQ